MKTKENPDHKMEQSKITQDVESEFIHVIHIIVMSLVPLRYEYYM